MAALQWMFPNHTNFEIINGQARHTFEPASQPITVERDLRRVCSNWQDQWEARLLDEEDCASTDPISSKAQQIETINDMVVSYTATKCTVRPATAEKNRHYLNAWRVALGADTPLRAITTDALIRARAALLEGRQPSSVNCMTAVMKSAFAWAHREGHISHQPHTTMKKLKEPRQRKARWWSTPQVDLALRMAVQDHHPVTAELLVALGCLLGLRYEEIIMQRWEDIDLEAVDSEGGPAPVCHVVPHDGWQPKSGEARTIPISEWLASILRRHRRPKGYLLVPEPLKAPRVKARKAGAKRVYRYDPAKVWKRLIERMVKAGVQAISPHGMRHSFASNLLQAGISDVKVARWLGHADTTLVHERYGHLLSYDACINAVASPSLVRQQEVGAPPDRRSDS